MIATTNASGSLVAAYKYGPFGESPSLVGVSHGFTGQRYDPETDLYYYKMRYYSPKIGRFLQPDPIEFSGGLNFYSYLGNSPLSSTDTMGLSVDGAGSSGGIQFGRNDSFAVGKNGFGWFGGTPPDTAGWIEQHWYGGTNPYGWEIWDKWDYPYMRATGQVIVTGILNEADVNAGYILDGMKPGSLQYPLYQLANFGLFLNSAVTDVKTLTAFSQGFTALYKAIIEASVHGNSRLSESEQIVYQIVSRSTGKLIKSRIGTDARLTSQVAKYRETEPAMDIIG